MKDIIRLTKIQFALIIVFVIFKLIRPPVLQSSAPEWVKIALLSLPNFFEALIGVLVLTGMGLYLNLRVFNERRRIRKHVLYAIVPIIGGVYVITQELKIHNLGGNNVYDSNDVIFSVIGLLTGYLFLLLTKPNVYPEAER
ncbi:hypothetical protein [uncultured Croceitalea sp.]|uniref:hypothetical protein n=1 Tax=uncultured Croceitalea sp. TaxID=1798908 RepID=UPI0033068943